MTGSRTSPDPVRATLTIYDELEVRPAETDEEPWYPPIRGEVPDARWEVDWWRAAGCALVAAVSVGFWGLVAWTVARALRGG